ncbi:MAG: DUF1592 domain-containing protein [Verrucomicrobiota bacterium]
MIRITSALLFFALFGLGLGSVFGQDQSGASFKVESDREKPFNDEDLSVQILADDLLSGASFTSNLQLQKGHSLKLTDGEGHQFIQGSCTFGEDGDADWIVTFSNLRIAELQEVRVFSSNGDARSRQDYDVSFSADRGQTFQLLAQGIIADQSGGYNLTRVPGNAEQVTDLRFTFRSPNKRHHSALYEIDAVGVPISVPTLTDAREAGRKRSRFLTDEVVLSDHAEIPEPDLSTFHAEIEPLLKAACVQCHGPEKQKGKFRVDTLDPNLHEGGDVDWWLEVQTVLSNHEMPPEDDVELADADRAKLIDWLSKEVQIASQIRRAEAEHSSFRRMTRYEYTNTLQDLLGLPHDFGADLPPETASADGFRNSSEMLTLTATQFETYRNLARAALEKATVRGERPEAQWMVVDIEKSAQAVLDDIERRIAQTLKRNPDANVEGIRRGSVARKNAPSFQFSNGNRDAMAASKILTSRLDEPPPKKLKKTDAHLLLPPGTKRNQMLRLNLGGTLPESGPLRLRIHASRDSDETAHVPVLQLSFGFGQGNNGVLDFSYGEQVQIDAWPGEPEIFEWDLHLGEIQRNPLRNQNVSGRDSTERISLANVFPAAAGAKTDELPAVRIDRAEIGWPVYDQWPPESHLRIFPNKDTSEDETEQAREILTNFLARAWRQPVADVDLERMMKLFANIRPQCQDFQEAVIEVLAVGLASPRFLYLVQESGAGESLTDYELATRLSYFLWCSTPDEALLQLAETQQLQDPKVLAAQTERMLADPRSRRFAEQFVHQWLNLEMLDILSIDKKKYPSYDENLKGSMHGEIIAYFEEILSANQSVLDFLESDFAMINQRLAQHYGIANVHGPEFQRVALPSKLGRGGLLTQGGVLAMTSNGVDSNPLRRGVWLLENLLNDPPPPPPPAVPEIDVADPEIAKLTLKERLEQHRDDPACFSCHQRIDPWGIAFENYDAVGSWRTSDSTAVLFNGDPLDGMSGLKRYLLENRQDQFAEALVHKMTTFALGRPLSFGDRSQITRITADLRNEDDGLATLVHLIIQSEIFRTK